MNVWDPIMRALGQKYGLGDVWAELSMHNRYFPFLAIGVGNINDTPVDKNYTFKSPVAPYFKLGGSYNFFYNSNPDYRLQMGLRYGFSTYKWSVLDVTVDEGYWNAPTNYSLKDLSNTAGYLEVTFGQAHLTDDAESEEEGDDMAEPFAMDRGEEVVVGHKKRSKEVDIFLRDNEAYGESAENKHGKNNDDCQEDSLRE